MKMGEPGYWEREERKLLGEDIKPKFNSVIAVLNQNYNLDLSYNESPTGGDVGVLARYVMYKIPELQAQETRNNEINTILGMRFLEKIADDLKADADPQSLYNQTKEARKAELEAKKAAELIARKINEVKAEKAQQEEETAKKRIQAKEVVSFYLALNYLAYKGVNVPEGMGYTDDQRILDILYRKIAQDLDLTVKDASPQLRSALEGEPKSVQDVHIGFQYFHHIQKRQKSRIKDEDVAFIDYKTKNFHLKDVVESIEAREGWEDLKTVINAIRGVPSY